MGGAMCCAAAAGEPIPEPSRWRDATPVCAEETEPMMYPCGYADIDVDCGRGGKRERTGDSFGVWHLCCCLLLAGTLVTIVWLLYFQGAGWSPSLVLEPRTTEQP
mmetsp:Transcript_44181/g.126477  ORF Transcript_44181/g.126477 Transcript_44181/m.126477 type:complete len:105 (+) Transcript_44181:69-383(+)